MLLTKRDCIELNYLSKGEGAEAIEYLAKILYEYYAHETVTCDKESILTNQGKAQLADWLKTLPKGLRDGYESGHTQ